MPQPREHKDHAARQAAYRKRQQQAQESRLREKGLAPLPVIPTIPGTARWTQAIEHASRLLTDVAEEMQVYFEDRSEAWQEGDRGMQHEERLAAIQEVLDRLGSVW